MKSSAIAVLLAAAFGGLVTLAAPRDAVALVNPEHSTGASPEDVTIEILESSVMEESGLELVFVRARVLTVQKSESGLVAGDEIEIVYARRLEQLEEIEQWFEEKARDPGWAGDTPRYPPAAPQQAQIVRAYLKRYERNEGLSYVPAADQYSFEPP
jgi:hypothetical protein